MADEEPAEGAPAEGEAPETAEGAEAPAEADAPAEGEAKPEGEEGEAPKEGEEGAGEGEGEGAEGEAGAEGGGEGGGPPDTGVGERIKKDPHELDFLTPLPEKVEFHHIPKISDARGVWRLGMRKIEECFAEHIANMHLQFEDNANQYEQI